ncbi:MAG: dihydroneopterin triphosphate diphosphatase [Pseudomonadota bacterium]
MAYKIPVSVLVLVHTPDLDVLLLERADRPGYWQSVTGSQDPGETLQQTARREVREETGLEPDHYLLADWQLTSEFEIYPHWRGRYAPGVTRNTEHVFALQVPVPVPVRVAPKEHLGYQWLPYREAAQKVFSWSNRDAILMLPSRCRNR